MRTEENLAEFNLVVGWSIRQIFQLYGKMRIKNRLYNYPFLNSLTSVLSSFIAS